jgi:arylsulfatase A-like enzyme
VSAPRRSARLAAAALALLAAGALWWHFGKKRRGGLPNILIVTCDTLRADRLHLYGAERETSPNLDALAKESVVFDNFFSNASFTPPSHASILTGLYPNTHGLLWWNDKLLPGARTIAEWLGTPAGKEGKVGLGYRTGSFVNLDNFRLMDVTRGFDHQRSEMWFPADELNRDFFSWLDGGAPQRFCAWLHYWDPHRPYAYRDWHWLEPNPKKTPEQLAATSPGDRSLYEKMLRTSARPSFPFNETLFGTGDLNVGRFEAHYNRKLAAQNLPLDMGPGAPPRLINDGDDRFLVDRYDGGVAYLDKYLGLLIDGLRSRGELDDTLLVITSDHGESFKERADEWFTHDPHLYDEVTHVPCIIRFPGGRNGGKRVVAMAQSVDLLPTVFDELGFVTDTSLARFQGKTLLPRIDGRAQGAGEAVFAQTQDKAEVKEGETKRWVLTGRKYSVRTPAHRLVWNVDANPPGFELYDLAKDRGEKTNIFPGNVGKELAETLQAWLDRTPPAVASERELSSEEKSSLPGYVQKN